MTQLNTPPFDEPALTGPERTSIPAVLSIVSSAICCIPGAGVLGALLGVLGLVNIARSGGRLGGRVLAVLGIVLGLLFSVMWVGISLAVAAGFAELGRYGDFVVALERDDLAGARTYLSPNATGVTDQRLIEWQDQIEDDLGTLVSTPDGLGAVFMGYASIGPTIQTAQTDYPTAQVVPLPVTFTGGESGLFIIMNQNVQMAGGMPTMEDVGYTRPDGSIEWLILDAPPEQP